MVEWVDLPPELWHEIMFSHSDIHTVLSLALTCRRLHTILLGTPYSIDKAKSLLPPAINAERGDWRAIRFSVEAGRACPFVTGLILISALPSPQRSDRTFIHTLCALLSMSNRYAFTLSYCAKRRRLSKLFQKRAKKMEKRLARGLDQLFHSRIYFGTGEGASQTWGAIVASFLFPGSDFVQLVEHRRKFPKVVRCVVRLLGSDPAGHPERMVNLWKTLPPSLGLDLLQAALQWGSAPVVEALLSSLSPERQAWLEEMVIARSGQSILRWAAWGGNTDVVALLLSLPYIDRERVDPDGGTPLIAAVERNHIEVVVQLMMDPQGNIEPLTVDPGVGQASPLEVAITHGHAEMAAILIQSGFIDPTARGPNMRSPLEMALRHGLFDIALLIIDTIGLTPDDTAVLHYFHLACCVGASEMVEVFLSQADLDSKALITGFVQATFHGRISIMQHLYNMIESSGRGQFCATWISNNFPSLVGKAQPHTVRFLLDTFDCVVDRVPAAWSRFFQSCNRDRDVDQVRAVIELLIGTGAVDLTTPVVDSQTPLAYATTHDLPNVVCALDAIASAIE